MLVTLWVQSEKKHWQTEQYHSKPTNSLPSAAEKNSQNIKIIYNHT